MEPSNLSGPGHHAQWRPSSQPFPMPPFPPDSPSLGTRLFLGPRASVGVLATPTAQGRRKPSCLLSLEQPGARSAFGWGTLARDQKIKGGKMRDEAGGPLWRLQWQLVAPEGRAGPEHPPASPEVTHGAAPLDEGSGVRAAEGGTLGTSGQG